MNSSEIKFMEMVKKFPFAQTYFKLTRDSIEMEQERLKREIHSYSKGEIAVLSFLANVFLNEDLFDFNFFEASKCLSMESKEIIANWFKDPFNP